MPDSGRARDGMAALREGNGGRAVIGASGAVIASVVPLETAPSAAGRAIPRGSVQSNSLLATIALVADSDIVAVISERAIELPEAAKMLRRLPMRLETQTAVTMYWRKDVGSTLGAVDCLLRAGVVIRNHLTRHTSAPIFTTAAMTNA